MSIQKGIIKLKGKLDDISFYESNGKALARKAGGVSKEVIMGSASFARVRENMSEFAGAARAGKGLRLTLAPVTGSYADGRLGARLVGIMKQICNLDSGGVRGQRSISITLYSDALRGFELNRNTPFSSVFTAAYKLTSEGNRKKAAFIVEGLDANTGIKAPAGATHYRLAQLLGVFSNYALEANTGEYQPVDAANNSRNAVKFSNFIGLTDGTQNITLETTLPDEVTPGADVRVVQCVGIEFYQRINGSYYILNAGNAMQVVGLF